MSEKKPWAVLVYLVADDQAQSAAPSLDQIAEQELDLMFDALDRSRMHLAVQVDYRLRQKVWRHLARDPLNSLPESSAADPNTIKRFLDWAYGECRADRYLILFWGHAFGTAGLFPDSRPGAPRSRDTLSLQELDGVLQYAKRLTGQIVDVLMFKNCCLSNVETAYQLQNSVELMLASQSLLPAKGWPYRNLFKALGAFATTEEIGHRLLRNLGRFYADTQPTRDVPYTLLRPAAARNLEEPMRRLSEAILRIRASEPVSCQDMVSAAVRGATAVGDSALPDVVNLCRNLRDPFSAYVPSIAEPALIVEQIVNREVVLLHFAKSSAFNGAGIFYRSPDTVARGDSVVATAADLSEYVNLAFCKDTSWSEVALGAGQPVSRERSTTAKRSDVLTR